MHRPHATPLNLTQSFVSHRQVHPSYGVLVVVCKVALVFFTSLFPNTALVCSSALLACSVTLAAVHWRLQPCMDSTKWGVYANRLKQMALSAVVWTAVLALAVFALVSSSAPRWADAVLVAVFVLGLAAAALLTDRLVTGKAERVFRHRDGALLQDIDMFVSTHSASHGGSQLGPPEN